MFIVPINVDAIQASNVGTNPYPSTSTDAPHTWNRLNTKNTGTLDTITILAIVPIAKMSIDGIKKHILHNRNVTHITVYHSIISAIGLVKSISDNPISTIVAR